MVYHVSSEVLEDALVIAQNDDLVAASHHRPSFPSTFIPYAMFKASIMYRLGNICSCVTSEALLTEKSDEILS